MNSKQGDLFEAGSISDSQPKTEQLAPAAFMLHRFAVSETAALVSAIVAVSEVSRFRKMVTRGRHQMSVAMTNCGHIGWTSDESGYRYTAVDPATDRPWPPMPPLFLRIAQTAADASGFGGFEPDACLINRYEPGAKMGLHQDKDERDFDAPIVSVSLGLPAVFLWGGGRRSDGVKRLRLESGDVVVWGGPARLTYHGVAPLSSGDHPLTGPVRYNLTFRKAL